MTRLNAIVSCASALRDYEYAVVTEQIDLEAWQLAEIQQAIEEADAGDFASTEEVDAVVRKYAD